MKIKSLLLATVFALVFFPALAKENPIQVKHDTKISSIKEQKNLFDDTKIQDSDFTKLFSEAEAYYKAAQSWKKLKCEPKTGFVCTKRECLKRDIKTTLVLDKVKKTISRCEDDHCDDYPAEFEHTGVFYNVQTSGPVGTLIRVLGDSRYKEISTVALDAYIANGECVVVVE